MTHQQKEARAWDTVRQAYGDDVVRLVKSCDVRIRVLDEGEKFGDVSLNLLITGEDDHPNGGGLGVFVPNERTLYIRDFSPLVIVHEFAHAIDFALANGNGMYTYANKQWKNAYHYYAKQNGDAVTNYARMGPSENFAEDLRALTGVNDGAPPYEPEATPERLMKVTPRLGVLAVQALELARRRGQALA